MARFKIEDYYDLGTKGYPTAGTWEAATDNMFNNVIARVDKDPEAAIVWVTPLEYTEDGIVKAHADLNTIYVRCKLWIDDDVSDWMYITESANQNDQTVVYTENKKVIKTANSLDIGFN